MPKWFKLIIGLLLLPVCVGAGEAVWRVVRASGGADTFWVAFLAGAGCWLAVYLLLPKPMRLYVFGHELTHALWTWAMGGQVKKFKVSASGGHVIVTKSNFLIALAPYFFPLYAVLVVLAFVGGRLILDLGPYAAWFHLLLGAAYAFHITLTIHVLNVSQSDITSQGWIFSFVVIFLGNVLVLLLAIPLLASSVALPQAFQWWFEATRDAVMRWVNRSL